uniref:NADH-ubiquinone oxidoreductase chain 4L n=1 Tax=Petrobius brevistylis TaxID=50562 RepID=Q2TCQ7_9INSE|nr:NADH dehydrogenase subunit 4L [Petrobius brevistylis]AAX39859.1 NADH dehydrogenase subunit 4L [Petrobius brevistylis]
MDFLVEIFLVVGAGIIVSGMFVFVSYRMHLLAVLFSLEYIVLGFLFLISFLLSLFNSEVYFSLFFFTLAVCEGALGLSILVSLVRSHGDDYFMSFTS